MGSQILRFAAAMMVSLLPGLVEATEFRTPDPLKAFVHNEYPLGGDYFIKGNQDTYIFRCLLAKEKGRSEGVALSEISIWGNRTGPWEIFRKDQDGRFVYIETKHLANTSCLESCRSKEYLASGQCVWQGGWPKQ